MRIDQFLQKTGIVKQRSLAKEICDRGAVEINGRKIKPAHEVEVADVLTVRFHNRRCTYKVLAVPQGNVRKDARTGFVQMTNEERFYDD